MTTGKAVNASMLLAQRASGPVCKPATFVTTPGKLRWMSTAKSGLEVRILPHNNDELALPFSSHGGIGLV